MTVTADVITPPMARRVTGDDVEHASRNTGAFGEHCKGKRRQRRFWSRLTTAVQPTVRL